MKVAVDTNVLLRLIVDDDSEQAAAADRLARAHHLVVSPTALLETEWVLRRVLGLDRDRIREGLGRLLGLQSATFLHRDAVDAAMRAFRDGLDFADALHAMLAKKADVFATFDRDFVRRARSLEYLPKIRLLPLRGNFLEPSGNPI